MNRTILLAIIAISSFATCHAQQISDVHIKDFTLELNDDKHLNVDIDLDLSELRIKPTQVVVLMNSFSMTLQLQLKAENFLLMYLQKLLQRCLFLLLLVAASIQLKISTVYSNAVQTK